MFEVRRAALDEFTIAVEMRANMSDEMGNSFDARSPHWRTRFCAHFAGKQGTGRGQLFFATVETGIAGMAIVSIVEHYRTEVFGERHARINAVFVKPQYRRRGIAHALMRAAIDWARAQRCVIVTLGASEDGRPLYEQLGFSATNDMALRLADGDAC